MSKLKDAFAGDSFLVTSELTPPKGTDLSDLFAKADLLKPHVHAFNITESHAARMSMDPIAAGSLLLKRDVEPIVQFTSRDKNRIAIQSGLLGAAALGISNVVFMGGDPPKIGDHPDAKGVFDLFASQLVEAGNALNNGKDFAGNDIKSAPNLFIGSVFNPGANDVEAEMENTHRKIDAGAKFFQTQAVFDPHTFAEFLHKLNAPGLKVLGGVIPLKSSKMAAYMNERVPGINIPDQIMQRMVDAESTGNVVNESLDIAAEIISELKSLCSGIHVMAIGWEKHVPELLNRAKLATH